MRSLPRLVLACSVITVAATVDPAEAARRHLGESGVAEEGWTLARILDGEQWLKVYTRQAGGHLSFRVEASVSDDAASILSVLREVDLLPAWNRFCDRAELLHLPSQTALWAAAGVKLPWPVPLLSLMVHAAGLRRYPYPGSPAVP